MNEEVISESTEPATEKQNKKPKLKLIIVAAGIVAIGVIAGIAAYSMSPEQRARKLINMGAKYLNELDYEQAYAQFAKALEIAPDNEAVAETINDYLDKSITAAETMIEQEEYASAMTQMEIMLEYSEAFKQETIQRAQNSFESAENGYVMTNEIAEGNASFSKGDYEDAENHYREAIDRGSKSEEVADNLTLSRTYQELLKLCKDEDWAAVAALMDSNGFDPLIPEIKDVPIYIGSNRNVIIGESDGVIYVITGELTDANSAGNAVAIFSGDNTYSVYEGEWSDRKPNGDGVISIWDKRDDIENAAVMTGNFENGLLNGNFKYTDDKIEIDSVEASDGKVNVIKTDENGRAVLGESESGLSYVINGETAKDDILNGYIAGVPGFGGSERRLEVSALDNIPPQLKCELSLSRWETHSGVGSFGSYSVTYADGKAYYEVAFNKPYRDITGYGIKAYDNLDGDLTDKIKAVSKRSSTDRGWGGIDDHILTVTYTVEDSSGNKSTMVVTYMGQQECEYKGYFVMSVKYE